jgi:type IV pilus assembly protein PilB
MTDELKNIPSKVNLEQFDISAFSKDKIRELFRSGRVPTAEAMVDEVFLRSIKVHATDLHFEPMEFELRIRYSIQGTLKNLVTLPKEISDNLTNVIKTKANLNTFEKKKPQEGRFSLTIANQEFDLRVGTVPVMFGERIAIRILTKNTRVANIEELGFTSENLLKMRKVLHRPNGLFLVTGPPSSGKSTTIYAGVNDVKSADKIVISIESPIEYKLDFASQVQLSSDKSFSYADALRVVLRQNANIIMLGEIRDPETGTVAAEAAISGNLVLSTILANDAIGAIFRLINLGVTPYWIASSLIGILNQQLVRKICPACKEEYKLSEAEHSEFIHLFSDHTHFYRGKGCPECNGTGFSGRTAIHEILIINDQIRDLIYQQGAILAIKEAARASGFEGIFIDAVKKVNSGLIAISELYKALG